MRILRTLAILVVSLFLAFSLSPVYAGLTSINTTADTAVSGDGFCSLREAITDSNAGSNVSGDCIGIAGTTNSLFIPAGDYTLSSTLPSITSNITISKAGAGVVNIQANAAANTATYRVFTIDLGDSLTLDNVTVRNGGDGSSAPSFGGCIFVNGTLIVQNNSSIRNCYASNSGGGIYGNTSSTITVTSSTVSSNSTIFVGAGIYCTTCSLTLTSATISSNAALGPFAATGGAGVYCNTCTLSVTGTTFSSNTAANTSGTSFGGALAIEQPGSYTISGSTFTGNSVTSATTASGGAIALVGGSPVVSLSSSVLSGNTSGSVGGAIYVGTGTLTLSTSRLFSNTATTNGDAIYSQATSGASTVRGSCITNNGDTAIFDTSGIGTIDASGGGSVAQSNWWGTHWGPRIAAAGGGSAVSNGDSINGNGDTVSGNILVDVNLSSAGTLNSAPTGEWQATAPTVAGATCLTCSTVSGAGEPRACY